MRSMVLVINNVKILDHPDGIRSMSSEQSLGSFVLGVWAISFKFEPVNFKQSIGTGHLG